MSRQTIKKAMTEELAIEELSKFLQKYKKREFRKNKITVEVIKESYPDVIEAICDGLMIFKENSAPTLTLRYPIKTEGSDRDLDTAEVDFRTRIKPSEKANVMDGLNIQTQQSKYVLKFMGFITGLTSSEIDKLDPEDYDTINQVCSVF